MALATVILSTYNQPAWLELCLQGYRLQDELDITMVIADDGSGEETRQLIERLRPTLPFPVEHLWQPNEGFRKTIMLNRAIMAAPAPYLIFSDGDCIPRRDFIREHLGRREGGRFLSGGYVRLSEEATGNITPAVVDAGSFADKAWLGRNGMKGEPNIRKLNLGPFRAWFSNRVAKARPRWNGLNASCWRADAIAVNGFDERMRYGAEDIEFGERLERTGIRARQVRYNAIVVHLEHPRGYRNDADMRRNKEIRAEGRAAGSRWTEHGIRRGKAG